MSAIASEPRLITHSVRLGRAYRALQVHRDRFIGIEGPRGTAKTRSELTELVLACIRWPGTRAFIARASRTILTQSVLATLENQVFPSLRLPIPGGQAREGRSVYRIVGYDGRENGSELVPLGLDDPQQKQRLFGSEWTRGYVSEVTECQREQVELLGPTLRHYPKPDSRGVPCWVQVVVDWNPVAPGHWIYQRTTPFDYSLGRVRTREDYARLQEYNLAPSPDKRRWWKRIITRYPDNPGYWDSKAWGWSELGREYCTETLDMLDGFQRRRLLDGEPCAASGSVFPQFMDDRNVCDPFPLGWPDDWPVIVGYDSGYDHPAAVVFYGLAPTGQPHIFDCIHQSGLTLEELGEMILAKCRGRNIVAMLADPRDVFKRTAHASGVTIAQFMRDRFDLRFRRWPAKQKAEVHNQVEAVRELIRAEKNPLQVWTTCPQVISEFQSWAYKRNADGSMPDGDDAFEDRNNHAMDAILGIVASKSRPDGFYCRIIEGE